MNYWKNWKTDDIAGKVLINVITSYSIHYTKLYDARHYNIPSDDPQHPRDVLAVDYGFASGFGGGLDIALSRHWAVRPLQFDYVLTNLSHDQPQFSPIQEQLRITSYNVCYTKLLRLSAWLARPVRQIV